jgi:hypothetical protein
MDHPHIKGSPPFPTGSIRAPYVVQIPLAHIPYPFSLLLFLGLAQACEKHHVTHSAPIVMWAPAYILHIETKDNHITIGHNIVLTLEAHLTLFL